MAFTDTWAALQSHLQVGETIQNWTAFSGVIGDPFVIESVDRNAIVVRAPGAITLQRSRRKTFEAFYEVWDDYVGRVVPRKELGTSTRHSKYVISILHWLEERSGGRLP